MIIKNRIFDVTINADEIKEIREALQERIDTLNEAKKTGGVLTQKHLERTLELFQVFDYLHSECE